MTFSVVGNGNIAWFFSNRLMTAGHRCVGVYARDEANAKKLSETLLSGKYGTIDKIVDGEADICFLVVSDAAIASVAAMLSFKETVLIHTAGSVALDSTMMAAKDRAVMWPVYSILKDNMPDHKNIPCAWEASTEKAKRYVLSIGHAITDVMFEAKYEQRKWLHLSAVIGNNFVNHLLAICEKICADNALPFSTLQPIIEQTFNRMKISSPQHLQTGPAIRHDTTTIEQQIALLADHPDWQKVYEAVTASIQQMNK